MPQKLLRIDVLNYQFKIELSDATDEIKCEVTHRNVRSPSDGNRSLKIGFGQSIRKPGKYRDDACSGFFLMEKVDYSHEGDELKIKLPTAPQKSINELSSRPMASFWCTGIRLKIADNRIW